MELPKGLTVRELQRDDELILVEVTPYHGLDDRNQVVTDGELWWYGGSSNYTYSSLMEYLLAAEIVVRNPAGIYDELADTYDKRYTDPFSTEENAIVADMVRRLLKDIEIPAVLDVGCGTGLALELGLIPFEMYVGIDPSEGMLKKLRDKFPQVEDAVYLDTFESFRDSCFDGVQYGAVISLFGTPSYIDPDYLERLFDMAPRILLMHYVKGYWHEYEGMPLFSDPGREKARELCLERGGTVQRLNNFQITRVG